jgi:NADH:ubiquinone oxidoreductase subunit 6 (subunit J)
VGATEQIHVVSLAAIGDSLFRNWSAPFEIASLVLVVAMLGAIILARGEQEE